MTAWEQALIADHRVARLATVDATGQPHVVPIVFAFDGSRLYTPIDAKPKRVGAYQLQRVRNIQANPHVAIVIDDYSEDWRQLAWVQIRGTARLVEAGPEHATGVALLHAKYSQYEAMPLHDRPIIVITPSRITGWSGEKTTGSRSGSGRGSREEQP
ncbi:MAG TPA: TIGR03668 family PPOX class F420-dependent oxidoreductase [Chloroflexi bacterium]|nr:TIGR03668 family PPOX class F420-dependent oxidoreductase [Chloroflexota bacterium]